MDRGRRFYAPAVIALGMDAGSLILLRPRNTADEMWALDQALRTCGVAAVVWWGGRLEAVHFRRLQLGCQRSGALGLFVRPAAMRGEPSWADIRLLVRPLPLNLESTATAELIATAPWPGNAKSTGGQVTRGTRSFGGRRVRIEILRCRAGSGSGAVEVEIDDETGVAREAGPGPLAAELACGAAAQREARA
jgi:protein ImuA